MQNYSNFQSVCLDQNLDDIAIDVLEMKENSVSVHHSLDGIHVSHIEKKFKLEDISSKLDNISIAIENF